MDRIPSKRRKLPALVAGICLFGALPASASIIHALEAAVDGQVASDSYNVSDSDTSGHVDAYGDASDTDGYAYSSAFGNESGVFFVSAYTDGAGSANSLFTHTWEITNTSAFAQNYTFDFYIYGGSIQTSDDGAGNAGSAGYELDIVLDGATLFESSASISNLGTLVESGVQLDGAGQFDLYYSWSGTSVSLDLGIIEAGDTSTLSYDLVGTAFGEFDLNNCSYGGYGGDGYGGDGYGGIGVFNVASNSCYSSVRFGDPNTINATPVIPTSFSSTAVPEPAPLGLLGAGVAYLFFAGRRRSRYS